MKVYLSQCKIDCVKFQQLQYKIPTHAIDWLGYADDISLFVEEKETLGEL